MLFAIFEIVLALLAILAVYIKWSHRYWKRRNVPYAEPAFPLGHMSLPNKDTGPMGEQMRRIYAQYKRRGLKHVGIYFLAKPCYMPIDLDLVKNVMTKDFQHFTDRGSFYNERDDPLTAHLFALGGVKWRNLRNKLSPTFTSGKMKMMFQTLLDCEIPLNRVMEELHRKQEPVDVKEIFARFTTNIISSCAFGLESNCFEDDEAPLRKYGKKLLEMSLPRALKMLFLTVYPDLSCKLGLRFVPDDVAEFFMKVVRDTVKHRETNQIRRNDFLQLLIDMKNENGLSNGGSQDGSGLTMNELAAECFVFYIGGFETSSTTSTFLMYELARNQDIQHKLREEINEVLARHGNKVTYDAINEMKYMEQIINESLRMYPPLPMLTRECVKDYAVPDSDVILEKGTLVVIPVLGYHMDSEYYPNPEKFDPERFNEKNKHSRHPYAHLPFGEGPRICIGMRFGMMQMKVGLTSLIRNYNFTVNKRTEEPIVFDAKSFIPIAEGGIWLNVEEINH